ncbi:glycosyltransferase family 2 protein [Gemelliphila palaticanis]|uniref:Glycosyltransferase family 2 protein n=1 Tax=Gemelliphila palaticanis TaxID=81950 RepID=A0ABX2SX46_9BACL|nr:glycosyltransferase family 2 protein [Gemella palaticanis]MBF0714765.1 glycosyltransferase family 2 protein [Gemella palaticanis]NYS46695.1 glycosyltransferase family 2 protein [Gemella palaticanis]
MNTNLDKTKDVFVDTVLINDEVIVKKIKNINNNVKLSVIISSYRKDTNLKNILDLLLSQTYKNFEVIIVDDTTNNAIENVFEKYNTYENINYIKKQLGSRAAAKNIALENSRGDYVIFLEEDILSIEDNYLENMYNDIKKNNAEVVVLANSNNISFIKNNFKDTDIISGEYYISKEIENFKHNIDLSLASIIFKKNFLECYKIKFNSEILEGENIYFKLKCFNKVNKLKLSTNSSYIKKYSRRSSTNKIIENSSITRLISTIKYIENSFRNKENVKYINYFCVYYLLELLSNTEDRELRKELEKEIKYRKDYFYLENIFQKILIGINPKIFVKMYMNIKEEF